MAVKKRRRARKKTTKKRKAATHRTAPKRRRKRARARVALRRVRRAPGRKRARRTTTARLSVSNPRRRSKARRRSRRNPAIPNWALAGLAGIAGLAAYAVSGAGSFALTQRIDPSMASLERNRYIAGGLAAALGLGVAIYASPVLGAGILAGGVVGLAGTDLYLALGKVLDKAPAAPAKIAGVYEGGAQQLQGVYEGGAQQLQGAYGEEWHSPLGQSYGYGYG